MHLARERQAAAAPAWARPEQPAPGVPTPAVGSKEGWQPAEFRSSRGARAAVQQSVEQYLDEDELEELRRTNLQVGCARVCVMWWWWWWSVCV